MSATARRGVAAFGMVAVPFLLLGGIAVVKTRRDAAIDRYGNGPYPAPVFRDGSWHDPETGERLDETDPRFDFHRSVDQIKREHDKDLREHPEKFAPPKYR